MYDTEETVDVRIGVIHSPKEIEIELPVETDREAIKQQVADALGSEGGTLWLTDRRGREVCIPSARIAWVEVGSPSDDRPIGFG